MSKEIKLGFSPFSSKIFAGTLLKCGKIWSKNKEDVTLQAVCAVAEYGLSLDGPIELAGSDKVITHRVTVEVLNKKEENRALGWKSSRIKDLEIALSNLIGIAGSCDGWHEFPSKDIDDANKVLESAK
jgi:hypothetical protein